MPTTSALTTSLSPDGVLIVTIDVPGESVNTMKPALVKEFERVFDEIDRDRSICAVVLMSGKRDTFIAGAGIEQFLEFHTAADAERASRAGQDALVRLAELRIPTVAAIHGACLGAGLETALACSYRIITDHSKTVMALPEVQLGLIPGAGGTQRLPRVIGLPNALDVILKGRNVRAKKALKMGLADEMVHPAILREVALDRAVKLAQGKLRRPGKHRSSGAAALLESNSVGRSVIFKKATASVLKTTHGHYPAPLAAIEAVRAGYEHDLDGGLKEEARLFGEMAMTEASRQLIFLFFATTALKKDTGVDDPAIEPRPVNKLAVLGAGFMGAGITAVAVQKDTLVRLKDTDTERVARGLASVRGVLAERLAKRQITRAEMQDMMVLAGGTTEYSGMANVDLVIEAVFEDIDVKHSVLREIEPYLPDTAVYASNTSTIPVAQIAEAANRPQNVLGMHFFSPVPKMPLLEVIVSPDTSDDSTVTAVAYGKRLGKTVIVVNDGPGFYTTRTLSAYMNEAGRLVEEGADIEGVDRALTGFGFPVGPMTLLDEVGIDVGGKVSLVLGEAFGERMAPSEAMRRVVESGRTGRKGRRGFYKYDSEGKKGEVDDSVYALVGSHRRATFASEEVVQRCVMAMVNEAALCLQDGILRSARDGDIGAVFGIGFPPFRGGPFRYVDTLGADGVVRELEELRERFGVRFEPAQLLVDMARARRRFYPAEGHPVR